MVRLPEMVNSGTNKRTPAELKLEDIPDSANLLDDTSEPSSARDGGRGGPSLGVHSGIPKMQYRKRPTATAGAGADPSDYTKRYPRDAIGEEMSLNGRFWRTYGDEAVIFDEEMLNVYKDTIDGLLFFAGLFSAVISTFVVQTSQNLQPDYGEAAASLLVELVGFQRAASNESSLSIPSSPFYPALFFPRSRAYIWVNSLWFISLTLSLIIAFVAVLVQQWLHQYMSTISESSSRERGRIRHARHMGLKKWQVPMIIGLLPILLHVSLGLFLAGLSVYLFTLDIFVAYGVAIVSGCVYAAYATCLVLPLLYYNCPYKTPLTFYLFEIYLAARDRFSFHNPYYIRHHVDHLPGPRSMKAAEQEGVRNAKDIDGNAISWLGSMSLNTSVKQVVLQAILGIHNRKLTDVDTESALGEIFDQMGRLNPKVQQSIMKLGVYFRPSSTITQPLAMPFMDTTLNLLTILQSPLRDNVRLPEDVWISIVQCADYTSPSALRLAVEFMKVWRDKLKHSSLHSWASRLGHRSSVSKFVSIEFQPSENDSISYFLPSLTSKLSKLVIDWIRLLLKLHNSTLRRSKISDLPQVFLEIIRLLRSRIDDDDRDIDILLDGIAAAIQLLTQENRAPEHEEYEMEARKEAFTLASCRIFTVPLTPVGQLGLLTILGFHNGISSLEAASSSAKTFYTNAIRCLLSPCSLDAYPQLRRKYGELEWELLDNVIVPFLTQSLTLDPNVAAEQSDLTCLQTGPPSQHAGPVFIRVFEEAGGVRSLYMRFKDPSLRDMQKGLPAYLAGHITDVMISVDTFDPLHISNLGSSTFSFVENLSFLTRLLLYELDWQRIEYLHGKLVTWKDISTTVWEDYIKHLHRWKSDEDFEGEWKEEHRASVTRFIADIHSLLPITKASPECITED